MVWSAPALSANVYVYVYVRVCMGMASWMHVYAAGVHSGPEVRPTVVSHFKWRTYHMPYLSACSFLHGTDSCHRVGAKNTRYAIPIPEATAWDTISQPEVSHP